MSFSLTAVTNFWGTRIIWASIYRTIRSTAGLLFSKTRQFSRTPLLIRRSWPIRSMNTNQRTLSAHQTSQTTKKWSSLPIRRIIRGRTLSSWQGTVMTLLKCARYSRSSVPQTESICRQSKKKTQASALTWSACSTISSKLLSSSSSPRATQGSARRVCGAPCSPFRQSLCQNLSALAMKIWRILTLTARHPKQLGKWRAYKSTM